MPAGNEVHHEVIHFSGHVQGVGFRYTALQIAREFEVAGYVQNLPDGRVRVEVEGEPREVDGLVTALEDHMHGYVRKVERTSGHRVPQFSGFGVR
jgi:acylphosphatase